ncbi:hypothetical protein ACWEO2_35695, partial [Nocardia sp. NPDC004278]
MPRVAPRPPRSTSSSKARPRCPRRSSRRRSPSANTSLTGAEKGACGLESGAVFRTALHGRCDQRPELVRTALPLRMALPA